MKQNKLFSLLAATLLAAAAPAGEDRAIDIVSTAPDADEAEATIIVTDASGNHATVALDGRSPRTFVTADGEPQYKPKDWKLYGKLKLRNGLPRSLTF